MTGVILQCRLDSTRLPRKALLELAGKPIVVRVMESLIRIPADCYILACDTDSKSDLAPLAESCGFTCISGPKEDVLERFCQVVRKTGIDVIIRATADNPWVFTDAAEASLNRFLELQKTEYADYFTYEGLPYGSGVEVFSARRLLEAGALTDSSYDHEHVGPAFYNHPGRFRCIREPALPEWNYPHVRTTIDTRQDYEQSCVMTDFLISHGYNLPVGTSQVLEAWQYVSRPLLFIPSIEPGQGTGHLRRNLQLIYGLKKNWLCHVYIPYHVHLSGISVADQIPVELQSCIINDLPQDAYMVIVDRFRSSIDEIRSFRKIGPVLAIDEGGTGRPFSDYLLDIIPGIPGLNCPPNIADVALLTLPSNRREMLPDTISHALVVAGGENAAGYVMPVARILSEMNIDVTVIDPATTGLHMEGTITVSGLVPGLREKLYNYDLVVTHYGFTAFEALAAGCRVLLFSPSAYHYRLARASGFSAISPGLPLHKHFNRILEAGISVPDIVTPETVSHNLTEAIESLLKGKTLKCPLCGSSSAHMIARYSDRTIAVCEECGMEYLAFSIAPETIYNRSYFFDEYRKQYNKTYLEDFESIKLQGMARIARIERIVAHRRGRGTELGGRSLLDIGCAYGPFLSAARDAGWQVLGTDISDDAVQYVTTTLGISAFVSHFPHLGAGEITGNQHFTAITLWYVIEHFENLGPVFDEIRKLLVPGGILAFSTPSISGISGRCNRKKFYQNSPRDHFSLMDPRKIRRQLARVGFSVVRIVYTGHHPERFPFMYGKKRNGFFWHVCNIVSRIFHLGDTFEVYAVKKKFAGDNKS